MPDDIKCSDAFELGVGGRHKLGSVCLALVTVHYKTVKAVLS